MKSGTCKHAATEGVGRIGSLEGALPAREVFVVQPHAAPIHGAAPQLHLRLQ